MYEEYHYHPLDPGDPFYLPPDFPLTEDGMPDRWGCLSALLGWLIIIILMTVLLAFTSCRTQRIVVEYRDSIRTEVRTETVYVPDTAHFTVPSQTAAVTTPDTTSHLETDFAVSDAIISGGLLYHTLSNKPHDVPVPTQQKIIYRDSIVYRDREVPVLVPAPATVPDASASQSTWLQQLRLWLGTVALIALLLAAGWGIFRIIRKIRVI